MKSTRMDYTPLPHLPEAAVVQPCLKQCCLFPRGQASQEKTKENVEIFSGKKRTKDNAMSNFWWYGGNQPLEGLL